MELTRLKKRLKTAVRGTSCSRDKRDEMMRRFVLLIRENQRLRLSVEKKLGLALGEFALCRGAMDSSMLEQGAALPGAHGRRDRGHGQHNVGQGAHVQHRRAGAGRDAAQLRPGADQRSAGRRDSPAGRRAARADSVGADRKDLRHAGRRDRKDAAAASTRWNTL